MSKLILDSFLLQEKKASDGVRTHDHDVGNVVLYQLSYTRLCQDHFIAPLSPER